MKQLGIFLLVINLFMWVGNTYAQESAFQELEQALKAKFDSYNQSRDDAERQELAQEINAGVSEILTKPAFIGVEFDNIKVISTLKSNDGNVNIYTWVLPTLFGTYEFFGYVQPVKDGKLQKVFELIDVSENLDQADRKFLDNQHWYGAVYYEIIEKKIDGRTMYTLLGWHPQNASLNKKVIDVMYIDDAGRLKFGAPIFQLPKHIQRRIIFEYSAQASMSLKYHKVRRFLFFKQSMIVFDHLAPPDLSLLNQFQYYGPDFSNDALKFKGGKWVYQSDIDARNLD